MQYYRLGNYMLKQLVFQGHSPCGYLVEDKNMMSLGSVERDSLLMP